MAVFRINYSKVISQANDIEALSRNLDTHIQYLEDLMGQIRTTWKGSASETFLRQCELLKIDMHQRSQDIQDVSNRIKRVANRIHQEDLEAAERARRLAKRLFEN